MQTLEQLEALAAHVHAGRAPVDVLESAIAEHVSRESMHKEAVEHAADFVDALNETPGAPRANLWTKAGVRVYFAGDAGYVTVGHDGSIGGAAAVPGRRRQSLTFSPEQLYPAQRRAYAQALDRYRAGIVDRAEEHAQERMARIDELRVAFGLHPFAEEDVEALEREAGRAAWQAAHEEGRGNPSHRRNARHARDPGDWVEIEDAAYDDEVDDWVTIEECACHSCTPMRLNPPKRKATGAYADLDSIVPVIAEALAKHGLTLDGLDGGAEGVKFTRGGKSRAGSCSYSPSLRKCKIMFNGLAWPAFTEEQRLNTVLHEAAHAIQFLTTGRSDHGPAWQRIARSIGCTGDKCMSVEASQAMVDAYAEARGLPKRKVITPESAREARADFDVGDYVSFEHKRERWYGKITGKDEMHARVMVQQPATRVGITGKIPYPLLQKEAPPRHAEKVAGVDKPAPGESLSAWQARTGREVRR
jgi:hypothetical protein